MEVVRKDLKNRNLAEDLPRIDWNWETEFMSLTPPQSAKGFDDDGNNDDDKCGMCNTYSHYCQNVTIQDQSLQFGSMHASYTR